MGFRGTVTLIGAQLYNLLRVDLNILLIINRGYLFLRKNCFKNVNSLSNDVTQEQIRKALIIRHEIILILKLYGINELYFVPNPVNVFFRYMDVTNLLFSLRIFISKKFNC